MSINPIFAEERQNKILSLLRIKNKLLVNDLCEEFSVSTATIRNDLNQLERRGLLKRTHGGAIPCIKTMSEQTSSQKIDANSEQKNKIAESASRFIENGDTIALDTGTTTYALAQLLFNKHNLTVVTADIRIATLLETFPGVSVILAGGELRKGFSCTTGAVTNSIISSFKVDKTFIATNSVDSTGTLSTPDIEQAQVKKGLLKMGNISFLLCDSTKFGKNSFAKFGTIFDIDTIITDSNIDNSMFTYINSKNIDIRLV